MFRSRNGGGEWVNRYSRRLRSVEPNAGSAVVLPEVEALYGVPYGYAAGGFFE